MRIAMVTPRLDAGGAERVTVNLSEALIDRGHTVALLADSGNGEHYLRTPRIERVVVPDGGRGLGPTARQALALGRFARGWRADVVHAQNVRACAMSVSARVQGIATIASFQGIDASEYKTAARVFRAANMVGCVSDELRDGLVAAGYPAHRARTIPNAVDPMPALSEEERAALIGELDLPRSSRIVACVGRMVPQKNHELFLDAAAKVVENDPSVHFVLVGDGPLRSDLERQRMQLGIEANVTFTGIRKDARRIIDLADVVVFSSSWEGLSLVALESLAAGTPLVTTPAHGMSELLSGGGGVISDPTSEALASALQRVLQDGALLERLGAEGRAIIERTYSLDVMVDAYEAAYRDVVERAGRRGMSGGR